jgi:dephospho-CoA kinase
MLRVALTGGIASGKSTVAAMLRERGCAVLDADTLGHDLLQPGQAAYDEVVRAFGNAILGADGSVDRVKLGAIVFADRDRRARLEQILHPRILEAAAQWFATAGGASSPGGRDFAFLEATLIYEAGYKPNFDRVVVCWCRREQQIERLKKRGLSPEDAERRLAAQMPLDEKRSLADDVIDCSRSIEETARQVDELLARLKQAAASRKNAS